ncbi:MAG: sulfatase-like hydrolase/transferase [Anaerolineales bacterium]|nr:MAG: sulfatase-like hydrolase/transferase [Anaerolineales bacterium]
MKKILPYLHPFFFALYPIIELRNFNIAYVDSASLVRPILVSLLSTALMWGILRLLTREWTRSGIVTTLIVIVFFSYGHIFLQIQSTFGEMIRHRYLLLVFAALFALAVWFIFRRMKNADRLVHFLTVAGAFLTLFSLAVSIQHDFAVYQSAREVRTAMESARQEANQSNVGARPDVYVILLDAHTSAYALDKYFNYDESAFTNRLEELGFYVAQCAQSNYPATKLSVTSTFYADYHREDTLFPLYSSLVVETLRAQGYRVVTFENRSQGHFSFGEDLRLSRNQMLAGKIDLTGGLSEFEFQLLETSLARLPFDMPALIPGFDLAQQKETEFYEHYQQTFFILNELKRLPTEVEGPKLVFAHFLVPHPPFIFTADGKFDWNENEVDGYLSNVEFIDSQITGVVQEIVAKSKIPPVIIIMGDHGPSGVPSKDTPHLRMEIFNAYYVNDAARADLYPSITPVNSFRVVFNNYFGTDYPLLEDVSYHAGRFEDFIPENAVSNECMGSR